VYTKECHKPCSKPYDTQVGQGTITFILQMKKQKLRKPGMHAQLLRANNTWIFTFLLKFWSRRLIDRPRLRNASFLSRHTEKSRNARRAGCTFKRPYFRATQILQIKRQGGRLEGLRFISKKLMLQSPQQWYRLNRTRRFIPDSAQIVCPFCGLRRLHSDCQKVVSTGN